MIDFWAVVYASVDPKRVFMKRYHSLRLTDTSCLLLAAIVYRVVAVALVIPTLPIRTTLPLWMLEWFERISYPLLAYSLFSLIFHKKIAALLDKYPLVLYVDLLISVGIISIGGSWRSSYFGYTITSIILFTIFNGKKGAFISTFILSAAALLKDPSGGLPSMQVFFVSDLDLRMGGALMYITTGVILGYFRSLLEKLETLSKAEVEKTAMEAKTELALELHDGAKQMVTAILLRMNPLIKSLQHSQDDVADELRWHWRGMNYLKDELNQIMAALREGEMAGRSACDIAAIIKEEKKIVEVMTGFSWQVVSAPQKITIPPHSKMPLRRFLSEALMNAYKHSWEIDGTITLLSSQDKIVLTITDKGRGFNYSEKSGLNTTGLKSLKHRTRELNGELVVETAPGKGCSVILTLPEQEG
jgi:signal transduction histidine kinase